MKTVAQKADVSEAHGSHGEAFVPVPELNLHGNPQEGIFQLQETQHMHLRRAAGWRVRALEGNVWITQDGDVRDIVLQPGDSFVLDRNSHALLSPLTATGATRIRLTLAASPAAAGVSRAVLHPSLA